MDSYTRHQTIEQNEITVEEWLGQTGFKESCQKNRKKKNCMERTAKNWGVVIVGVKGANAPLFFEENHYDL